MSNEDILQAGIAAVRSGERERAAGLFAQVVKADPFSEEGWYWLGLCCSAPEQREYCFRRVLALNPSHLKAKQQLERLSAPAPFVDDAGTRPARSPQPAATHATNAQEPIASGTAHVSPFVDVDQPAKNAEEKPASPAAAQSSPKAELPKTFGSQHKKSNKALIALALVIPALVFCGLAGVYVSRSGGMAAWFPPGFFAFLTPAPLPAQTTLLTSIPPTAEAESTPGPPTAIPSPKPTVTYTALFEEAQCPFELPAGANVNCGYMTVPEDRTGDPSHTIRLAVAVYHSTGQSPAAEPVIFLQGGPGGEAVNLSAAAYDILVAPFLPKRDFIVFDQRGTGLSEPALKCEELTKAYLNDIRGLVPGSTRKLVYSNAFLSCNGLMIAQGVNLNAYTTVESAADVRDLLKVLGYERVHLYGVSYGTRLAQVIMRDYAEIVESAILDSVVPVETSLFQSYPDSIAYALHTLFDGCAADPACQAAYPQLETVFWEIVNRLDAEPVSITTSNLQTGTITEDVNGSLFMDIILGSIKQASLISTAPQSIYRFRNGDYSTMIAAQYSLPFAFEGISPGLYISTMCHEHVLTTTLDELQTAAAARASVRDYVWLPFYGGPEDLFKTCKSWGTTGPWLGENEPVISEIPTLIITGKYDPTTPPLYARQIAAHLSHSYYFEFPDQGHAPTATDSSGCAMQTALAFLDDPSVEPDRACLNEMHAVEFLVPYTGTPAVPLETVEVMGISVEVPKNWASSFFDEGTYWRANSPLDITQVSVLQTYLSAAEVQDWFSSKAFGYRGLDTAPIQAGQRQANGLTWTLYTSTSHGRPYDMAMADYRGQSLVVMMFCNSDEHEALYRMVFLPMVDSARP